MNSTTMCSLVRDDFLDDAVKIRQLGKGNYGNVYLIQKPDGRHYAIKYMDIDTEGVPQSTLLDIDALLRLQNVPDVIDVIGICYETNRIALILEAMDTDLRNFIDRTPINDRITLTRKLLNVLIRVAALMETLNITHFDIKPQNILVKGTEFKVTDFGLAKPKFGSNVVPTDEVYTLWYRPPEFLADRDRTTFQIFSGDIWAIGITVLEFIIGRPVFQGHNIDDMLRLIYNSSRLASMTRETFDIAITNGTITGNVLINIPQVNPQITSMLSRMLLLNPNDRPTGIQLFNSESSNVNPDFLSTLLQPLYPRRIHGKTISIMIQVCQLLRLSRASILIAIEIFTRYLDMLSLNLDQDIHIRALSSVKIAREFTEINPGYIYQILNAYREIYGFKYIISNARIIEMEKNILNRINFQIYNLNLGPVIERAYSKNIDLFDVDVNQFAEPLFRWLI